MSKFRQALAYLLPEGYAWPRDPSSVWMRLLGGVADAIEDVDDFLVQAVREWMPHSTRTRLAEWEEATGLPDDCFGAAQTEPERQARVLARLRGPQGAYEDSSTAAPAAIEALLTNLGFEATARYNSRFRCGRDRVGRRVGNNDGRLNVVVQVEASSPLRVGVGRVGQRLVTWPAEATEMACALDRVVPARFALNTVITES